MAYKYQVCSFFSLNVSLFAANQTPLCGQALYLIMYAWVTSSERADHVTNARHGPDTFGSNRAKVATRLLVFMIIVIYLFIPWGPGM